MALSIEKIKSTLANETLLSLATTGKQYPDNSIVCFAYDEKLHLYFGSYLSVFEKEMNELYEITPLVIWNYNPAEGEMHRDELILDTEYYNSIPVYKFHKYKDR